MTFDPSQLVVNMDAIRRKIVDQGAQRAVMAGARVIGAAMVEAAPELTEKSPGSDSLEPGDIKGNIKVRPSRKNGETAALVGPKGKEGLIPKTAYLVEYGHRMVTGGESKLGSDGVHRGGGKVHEEDVPPYPFLRPALESSAEGALVAVGESLREDLKGGS